jgi:predicted ATPase
VLEDKINFRHLVVREQDRLEAAQSNLPRFVWRVHDRGIHDGAGYCMIEGTAVPDFLRQPRPGRYDVVFLFEPVPHGMDMNGVRQLFPGETDEYRRELNATLRRAYEDNGYPVVTVPFAPVPERVDFVRQTMEVVHSRSGLSTVRMTLPQAADLAYAHN